MEEMKWFSSAMLGVLAANNLMVLLGGKVDGLADILDLAKYN